MYLEVLSIPIIVLGATDAAWKARAGGKEGLIGDDEIQEVSLVRSVALPPDEILDFASAASGIQDAIDRILFVDNMDECVFELSTSRRTRRVDPVGFLAKLRPPCTTTAYTSLSLRPVPRRALLNWEVLVRG